MRLFVPVEMALKGWGAKALIAFCALGLSFSICVRSYAQSKTCDVVRLSGARDWFPISMRVDEISPLQGILPDLARDVFFALKLPVAVAPDWPWRRAFMMLESGQSDVLAGAYRSADRLEKFGYSIPVMAEEVAIFMRSGRKDVPGSLEDLVGLRGMIPFGASFGEEFDSFAVDNLSLERLPVDGLTTHVQMLIDEKIDYLVAPRRDGEWFINQMEAADKVVALPWPAAVNTVHFLFSKASPCIRLLEAFNVELGRQIEGGILDRLTKNYDSGKMRYN